MVSCENPTPLDRNTAMAENLVCYMDYYFFLAVFVSLYLQQEVRSVCKIVSFQALRKLECRQALVQHDQLPFDEVRQWRSQQFQEAITCAADTFATVCEKLRDDLYPSVPNS